MEFKELIFSNQFNHRFLRHFFFWVGRFGVLVASGQGVTHVQGFITVMQMDSTIALFRLISQFPFCYFILYLLIPNFFLRKKYTLGLVLLIMSIIVVYLLDFAVLQMTTSYIFSTYIKQAPPPSEVQKIFAFLRVLQPAGPLVTVSLMCSLKFLKIWYVKQQENTELVRENGKAELQLLKAQVHPHFLFNTLNNIYSFTLTKSPIAADLLEKLSGILHYMILEGQNALVPAKKEIQLIQDYISLEKVRYGERLEMNVKIQGNFENKLIAPLLMIPFVENSFKHGSSKMLTNPKVELSIYIEGNQLIFTLKNNKPGTNTQETQSIGKGGIGLKNTAKRLQLLYPGKHDLKIESTDTSFCVVLNITLQEMNDASLSISQLPTNQQALQYANP